MRLILVTFLALLCVYASKAGEQNPPTCLVDTRKNDSIFNSILLDGAAETNEVSELQVPPPTLIEGDSKILSAMSDTQPLSYIRYDDDDDDDGEYFICQTRLR